MGMDRPGIEPRPSRMLSGCDATTPTAPELRRPRVLNYLLSTAFSAEALSRPARSACFLPICCRRTPLVGACCGQTSAAWKSAQAPWSAGPPVRPLFFLSAAGALLWFLSSSFLLPAHSFGWCSLWTNEWPGKAREAKLLWLAGFSGPIALLRIGLKRDVRHPAAAEQAAGAARCGEASAASKRAGREAVLAGCALGTDSFLLSTI